MRELVREAIEKVGNMFGNKSTKCTCMACDSIDWMEKTFDCAAATEGEEYVKALNFVNKNVKGRDEMVELLGFTIRRIDEIHPHLKTVAETYMKLYMINQICLEKLKEGK